MTDSKKPKPQGGNKLNEGLKPSPKPVPPPKPIPKPKKPITKKEK